MIRERHKDASKEEIEMLCANEAHERELEFLTAASIEKANVAEDEDESSWKEVVDGDLELEDDGDFVTSDGETYQIRLPQVLRTDVYEEYEGYCNAHALYSLGCGE